MEQRLKAGGCNELASGGSEGRIHGERGAREEDGDSVSLSDVVPERPPQNHRHSAAQRGHIRSVCSPSMKTLIH